LAQQPVLKIEIEAANERRGVASNITSIPQVPANTSQRSPNDDSGSLA
jgi:hypothetical protein